jgi:hypothetical protein
VITVEDIQNRHNNWVDFRFFQCKMTKGASPSSSLVHVRPSLHFGTFIAMDERYQHQLSASSLRKSNVSNTSINCFHLDNGHNKLLRKRKLDFNEEDEKLDEIQLHNGIRSIIKKWHGQMDNVHPARFLASLLRSRGYDNMEIPALRRPSDK